MCNSAGRQVSLGPARVFPETGSAVAGWYVQHPAAATAVPNRGDGEGKPQKVGSGGDLLLQTHTEQDSPRLPSLLQEAGWLESTMGSNKGPCAASAHAVESIHIYCADGAVGFTQLPGGLWD